MNTGGGKRGSSFHALCGMLPQKTMFCSESYTVLENEDRHISDTDNSKALP